MTDNFTLPEVCVRSVNPGYRMSPRCLSTPAEASAYICDFLKGCTVEHMFLLTLGTDLRPINYSLLAKGTVQEASFSMPELLRTCILSGANSVVVFHNHTGCSPTDPCIPKESEVDIQVSRRIRRALQAVGIELVDFIIAGNNGRCLSFYKNRQGCFDEDR